MTMINYLIGRSVDMRHQLLEDKISSLGPCSILHLVPARGRVIDLEADHRFWLMKKVNTLTGIIYRIFEEDIRHKRFKNHAPVDDDTRSWLVRKAVEKRMSQPDGLIYFERLLTNHNKTVDFPNIYRTIAEFFSQLIRNNYQDMFAHRLAGRMIMLNERDPGMGEERYAMENDLVWLLGDYEEMKREVGVYDGDDVISSVRDFLFDRGEPSVMQGIDIILFDGFVHVSRIEEDILFNLFSKTGEVWWPLDYNGNLEDPISDFKDACGRENTGPWQPKPPRREICEGHKDACKVFAPMVSLMERLEDAGIGCRIYKAGQTPFINPLAGGLYWNGLMEEKGGDNLRIRPFCSIVDEVRGIATEIKRIIHEDKLDLSRDLGKIRLIFPNLDDYSPLIFEIFKEYGLPFSLTKGIALNIHPLSDLFLHIFKIPINHFHREDILNLFSTEIIQWSLNKEVTDNRFFPESGEYLLAGDTMSEAENLFQKDKTDTASHGFDISMFDRTVRRCGISNLGDNLSPLTKEGLLAVKDFVSHSLRDIKNPAEAHRLRAEYYGFLVQADIMKKKLQPFQGLFRQNSPLEIANRFSDILDELGLPENIINLRDPGIAPAPLLLREMIKRDLKAYLLLKKLISSSAAEMAIAGELFHLDTGHDLLSNFYSVFRQRLKKQYLLDERNPNVIRISQWLEIRGRSFDYVFAGGLTADRFPLSDKTDFILTESLAKIFRIQDNVHLSRHLFSHLLRNYRKRLYLSYPRFREDKALQPSQILLDMDSMVKRYSVTSESRSRELEEIFRWEDTPFIPSDYEMLNAHFKKNASKVLEEQHDPFQLRNIILREGPQAPIRGIMALACRRALDGLFEYDGLVGGAKRFGEFLNDSKDKISASQLETMANCPMRYLFEYIYGLERMEEPGLAASPRDIGKYVHRVLSLFFRELLDQGKNVYDIGLSQAFSEVMEIARDYTTQNPSLNRLDFFEMQETDFLAGLERDPDATRETSLSREGVLAKLLRFEETAFRDRVPEGVEYEFGNGEDLVLMGRTRLKGYIDRFDRDKVDREKVYIYDYKTGRIPSSNMVKKGLSFQLPVYIRALRSIPDISRICAAFYALKKDFFLKDDPLNQVIVDHVPGVKGLDLSGVSLIDCYADMLMDNMQKGYFHHSADEVECVHCDFRYACHKDERRMDYLLGSGADSRIYSGSKNLETWEQVDQFKKEWEDIHKSMQKAVTLKTDSARKRHFESVMKFDRELRKRRNSLPFHNEYIDELLAELKEFEKSYHSS
jgi:hypothetical protein